MAPTHSDSYTIPFKVNLMHFNDVTLMKLLVEFPWAKVESRKKTG